MKKTTKFLLGMCLTGFLFQNSILAQEINIKPRPSTLHKILLESEKFPKKELVQPTKGDKMNRAQFQDAMKKIMEDMQRGGGMGGFRIGRGGN